MNSVLTVLVLCMLAVLVVSLLPDRKSGRKDGGAVTLELDADSTVDVEKAPGGVTVRIRYATFEDRPDDGELFPDIANEPVRSDYALDETFWSRLSHIEELDAQSRKSLLDRLQECGFIRSADVSRMCFGGGAVQSEDVPIPSSDVPDGPGGAASSDVPDDFYRPFDC